MLLALGVAAQAPQAPVWHLPDASGTGSIQVSFDKTSNYQVQTSSSTVDYTGLYVGGYNAWYDEVGNLLFYVESYLSTTSPNPAQMYSRIYDATGTPYKAWSKSSGVGSWSDKVEVGDEEIAIVPVEGHCDLYYVIMGGELFLFNRNWNTPNTFPLYLPTSTVAGVVSTGALIGVGTYTGFGNAPNYVPYTYGGVHTPSTDSCGSLMYSTAVDHNGPTAFTFYHVQTDGTGLNLEVALNTIAYPSVTTLDRFAIVNGATGLSTSRNNFYYYQLASPTMVWETDLSPDGDHLAVATEEGALYLQVSTINLGSVYGQFIDVLGGGIDYHAVGVEFDLSSQFMYIQGEMSITSNSIYGGGVFKVDLSTLSPTTGFGPAASEHLYSNSYNPPTVYYPSFLELGQNGKIYWVDPNLLHELTPGQSNSHTSYPLPTGNQAAAASYFVGNTQYCQYPYPHQMRPIHLLPDQNDGWQYNHFVGSAAPAITNNNLKICSNGNVPGNGTFNFTPGGVPGSTGKWYDAQDKLVHVGMDFTPTGLTALELDAVVHNFSVSSLDPEGCESLKTPLTVTIYPHATFDAGPDVTGYFQAGSSIILQAGDLVSEFGNPLNNLTTKHRWYKNGVLLRTGYNTFPVSSYFPFPNTAETHQLVVEAELEGTPCRFTDNVTVTVCPDLVVLFPPPSTNPFQVCSGQPYTLNADFYIKDVAAPYPQNVVYEWLDPSGNIAGTSNTLTVTHNVSNNSVLTYTLNVRYPGTDCEYSSTVDLSVQAPPPTACRYYHRYYYTYLFRGRCNYNSC